MLIAGAALAAPALVLEVRDAGREITLPLRDTSFSYSYRQSIYDVTVREDLRVAGDRIRVDRAVSADPRALEYFRWPGAARAAEDEYEWSAPANAADALDIVVAADGAQAIDTGAGGALALEDAFGTDARVRVTVGRRPLALWLWALVR